EAAKTKARLEGQARDLDEREKSLRSTTEPNKAALAKMAARTAAVERREEALTSAQANLEKREAASAKAHAEIRERQAALDRARRESEGSRKDLDATRLELATKAKA